MYLALSQYSVFEFCLLRPLALLHSETSEDKNFCDFNKKIWDLQGIA